MHWNCDQKRLAYLRGVLDDFKDSSTEKSQNLEKLIKIVNVKNIDKIVKASLNHNF